MKLFLNTLILGLFNGYFLQEINHQHRLPKSALKVRKGLPRIIGGGVVIPHTYPFMVRLEMKFALFMASACGGSLISTFWVLTAAHCIKHNGKKARKVTVILGAHNIRKTERTAVSIPAYRIIPHPHYVLGGSDIALIKLLVPVTLNEYIGPITYETVRKESYLNLTATVIGWGDTWEYKTKGKSSPVLKEVSSQILTKEKCELYFKNKSVEVINDSHICLSGEGNVGGCTGDSGGPLLIDGVQVGIVSFGPSGEKMCQLGNPTVFDRVSHYHKWIENTMNGSNHCANFYSSVIISVVLCLLNTLFRLFL